MKRSFQRAALLAIVVAAAEASEGTTPRKSAADYQVRLEAAEFALGADYMVRTVGADAKSIFIRDYLVVEVALYPSGKPLRVSASRFSLRVNGSKGVIYAQLPNIVAASLRYPDWENDRRGVVVAGPVIIGRNPGAPRFPGDDRDRRTTGPVVTQSGGEDASAERLVTEAALREGESAHPVSGYLYFPYRGKPEKIRSLELVYQPDLASPAVTLKLR